MSCRYWGYNSCFMLRLGNKIGCLNDRSTCIHGMHLLSLKYFNCSDHSRIYLASICEESCFLKPYLESRISFWGQHIRFIIQIVEANNVRSTVMVVERWLTFFNGIWKYTPLNLIVTMNLNITWYKLVILDNDLVTKSIISLRACNTLSNLLLDLEEATKLVHVWLLLFIQNDWSSLRG